MIQPLQFREAADWITKRRHPLLLSHAKPDGDALGSLAALHALMNNRGDHATAVLFDSLPDRFAFLDPCGSMVIAKDAATIAPLLDDADAIVVADTSTYGQLGPAADWLRNASTPILVIDHHQTRDDLADQCLFDESAAATCSIIFDLARAAGWPIDIETAQALFVGIATDTGWFRHSNTDARALADSAELISLGVQPFSLHELLYLRDSTARVRLLGEALSTLEFHAADRIAVMSLSQAAFARSSAVMSDTEDIVNEPMRIASVVVSMLLVEQGDGLIRANLRSKPPCPRSNRPDVDVAAIANRFGGGGHRRAAGARVDGSLADVSQMIRETIVSCLP